MLYCIVLYYTALYCIVNCIVLYGMVWFGVVWYCTEMYCIVLYCTALYCIYSFLFCMGIYFYESGYNLASKNKYPYKTEHRLISYLLNGF